MLKTLDGYGMIVREADETDRRAVILSLSPRGAEATAELLTRNNERVAAWMLIYSPKERAVLVDLLLRMSRALAGRRAQAVGAGALAAMN